MAAAVASALAGAPPGPGPPASTPAVSIAAGIVIGLVSALVQSLGLTLQRKSLIDNAAKPLHERKADWKRPCVDRATRAAAELRDALWVFGLVTFVVSNALGSVFQLGALPIVVLAPLGGVSLLFNALFARFVLGDHFSVFYVGFLGIIAGAILIGLYGTVPEQPHDLTELLALFARRPFVVFASLLALAVAVVLVGAVTTEYSLERRMARQGLADAPQTPKTPRRRWRRPARRYSISTGVRGRASSDPPLATPPRRAATIAAPRAGTAAGDEPFPSLKIDIALANDTEAKAAANEALTATRIARVQLLIGCAYGALSGILSGMCLLFAKTAVELLVLTALGHNQFGHFQTWLILLVLVFALLLQLWNLNRALRLVGPTLICPLAFCFYNLASIAAGLIYYDQLDMLSSLQIGMVCLGMFLLLAGVWVVSLKSDPPAEPEAVAVAEAPEMAATARMSESEPLLGSRAIEDDSDYGSEAEDEPQWLSGLFDQVRPRGFSIGIGAASPGFALRPERPSHVRFQPSASTSSYGSTHDSPPTSPRLDLKMHRRLNRSSLGGEMYVNALALDDPTADDDELFSSPAPATAEFVAPPRPTLRQRVRRFFGRSSA